MSGFTDRQQLTLIVGRHISGSLSLIASSIIIYQVALRYKEQKRSGAACNKLFTPYHRLLLGTSIVDILYSFWAALGTIPLPRGTDVLFALGTTATCSIQGFFTQFVITGVIYAASLSTYFMLKIRYNISDAVISRRYEPFFHLLPIVFSIGTGIMGLSLKIFNPMVVHVLGCWIGPIPADCVWNPPCTRGYKFAELQTFYLFLFAYTWLFASFFVILVNNVLIYLAIRHQELRNATYVTEQQQRYLSTQRNLSDIFLNGVPQEKEHLTNIDVGQESVPQVPEQHTNIDVGQELLPKEPEQHTNIDVGHERVPQQPGQHTNIDVGHEHVPQDPEQHTNIDLENERVPQEPEQHTSTNIDVGHERVPQEPEKHTNIDVGHNHVPQEPQLPPPRPRRWQIAPATSSCSASNEVKMGFKSL